MHLDYLLARDGCVQCPSIPPVCNCDSTQSCFQIAQSCTQCASFRCVDKPTSSNSGHGISAGGIAGAVVGALVFLAVAVGLFLWWRHRNAAPIEPVAPEVKDIPAPADTVLNRPDPSEKIVNTPSAVPTEPVVRVYGNSSSTIDLDPTSQPALSRRDSAQSNPFGDGHSIQTTSTGSQSTNVIPIAFVPPPASFPSGSASQSDSTTPQRPYRMPAMDLNMDHMNLSAESVPANFSDRSGISVIGDDRSYITNASYASDVLAEVPTIVTGRQIASAAKAAVVPASARSLTSSRPPIHVLRETDEDHPLSIPADPFADRRSPGFRSSMATQGSSHAHVDWNTAPLEHPWNAGLDVNDPDRPLSTYTQAASVIGADIMDATRVHLGFVQPVSASLGPTTPVASSVGSAPRALVRVASGRLVQTSTPNSASRFERQQERAPVNVQGQAQQVDKGRTISQRMSMSTMASGVSGRADSILESFTFVPPSPISNRPLRTPPRSPLAQETPSVPSRPAPAPVRDDGDLEPPNRQILGMSTGSQFSSISTGLGSFPFQIDHGSDGGQSGETSVEVLTDGKVKQRASLDTLVLTKDLTSYPLGFDRQSKDSFS
ncbi:hypothetical protein BJY52DRAFT_1237623 [Lactarius psammicola]|nr:hypothetical protein BJY52DRAFT_1237623 [Lactarius psammicola]